MTGRREADARCSCTRSGGIVPFRGRGATCLAVPTISTSILQGLSCSVRVVHDWKRGLVAGAMNCRNELTGWTFRNPQNCANVKITMSPRVLTIALLAGISLFGQIGQYPGQYPPG